MREIVHIQAGQCGNQIGSKVGRIPVLSTVYADWNGNTISLTKFVSAYCNAFARLPVNSSL